MIDIWNPKENEQKSKDTKDYYLIDPKGHILRVVRNDMQEAVKIAQRIMNSRRIKVQIIPRKGR